MEITEEQQKRAEANRQAALAKRKIALESSFNQRENPWKLFKCQKLRPVSQFHKYQTQQLDKAPPTTEPHFSGSLKGSIEYCSKQDQCQHLDTFPDKPFQKPLVPQKSQVRAENCSLQQQQHVEKFPNELFSERHFPVKFRVRLEICSPDSFSIKPEAVQGFSYPGQAECFRRLSYWLSDVELSHYTQNHGGGKACVYKLMEYAKILKCLKTNKEIELEKIPGRTLNVVEKFSHSCYTGKWMPNRPEHLSEDKVDELLGKLPCTLFNSLLPFQLEAVRFGLRRGGKCLIADEMGLGKTLQAIALASCFMNEGPILVVCPAVLRYTWAEELERWLPCLPADIHLVFGRGDNPAYLERCPRFVVISYKMLHLLKKSIFERYWAFMIVDESHQIRCTKKKSEPEETKAVLDIATKVNRIVLLTGTPSLSRPFDIFHQINLLWPGLLGASKFDFAKTYCAVQFSCGSRGKTFKDFSKGVRLQELNVLLKQTVMIRRLKEHVLTQLPPKRRQIIRLSLRKADIISAMVATKVETRNASEKNLNEERMLEPIHESFASRRCIVQLSYQELGVAKLSGFREWLSLHPIISEVDDAENMDRSLNSHKMIIFAHHHKVLDGIQEFICEKGIGFVRIDGNTLARDRQLAVHSFRSSAKVKIAIIGIEAGGVGIDFSSAQNVVFLELPRSPSAMLQCLSSYPCETGSAWCTRVSPFFIAEGRAHRQGQINAVNIYIFCAKDSLDELCWQNLNKSLQRVSSVTDGKYDAVQEIVVEDVTYLEASCRSDKSSVDRIMENEESGESREELAKLPNITGSQDVQSHELGNKSWEQTRRGNLSQSDNFCGKADISSTRQMEEGFRLQMESEGNASQVKVESCDRVSCEINGYGVEKEEETFIAVAENNAGGHMPSLLAKEDCYNQVNSLRFEVSRYTGRIHLYSCTPGLDSRPRPLFESFRPEEIELLNSSDSYNNNQACGLFKEKPTYLPAIKAFIIEWKKLRPIKQKRLIGKPLQLPLMTELWFLSESKKHNSQGLLKGGSKHRTRPLQEINNPLPSNATWRDVHLRGGSRKRQNVFTQGWTSTEEPLCKLCQAPCIGNNAKRPEFLEDLFCNLTCYEEFRIRTSNRYIRQELFKIEHGICTNCQLDCHQLVLHLKPLSLSMRREYIKKVAPKVAMQKNLLDKLVKEPTEGNSWHADHIVPVYRGGGECTLENMRTLCVACHSEVTAAQCTERRLARTRAKKQLKLIMTDLKKCKAQRPNANLEEQSYQHLSDILVEDELIVRVPGSAYSEEDKSTATDLENPT